jgi:hypothetical protein
VSTEYYVAWRSRTGARKALLTLAGPGDGAAGYDAVLRLSYRRQVNAAGWFRVDVPGNAPFLSDIADRDQVQIWRRLPGLDWAVDFEGVYRDEVVQSDELGQEVAQLSGPGALGMLSDYHVLFYADTADQTTFTATAAETILKRLVRFNATSEATTGNGRLRTIAATPISVQADAAGGETLTIRPGAYRNLLATLQRVQEVAGLDFDLIRTGANAWEFRTYAGQRGTDRRSTLVLSRELGTLRNIRYEVRRSAERTVAAVGGRGEGSARAVVLRTGATYATDNEAETFIDAGDATTTAALESRGDVALSELQSRPALTVEVVPTESVRYGDQLDVGDLLRLAYPRIGTIDVQVAAVSVEVEPGSQSGEGISVEVEQWTA